jgi:propionyl-CoA carboxylase alpha chain
MGEQAVALAKNVGYYSAGTCEFLVDPKRNFYFLEMNTRLQVEHPITEYITGLDLVEQMIRVAAGQKLNLNQAEIAKPKGWAFESRVYAEDPEKYLPSIGTLSKYIEPKSSVAGEVRCDSGIVEGSEISIYYDPLICKLCTYGETREIARHRMETALDSYVIKGVTHNIPLLRDVVSNPRFAEGRLSTNFLPEEYPKGFKGATLTDERKVKLYSIAGYIQAVRDMRNKTWITGGGSMAGPDSAKGATSWDFWVKAQGVEGQAEAERVLVQRSATDGKFKVSVGGKTVDVTADWKVEGPLIDAKVDGEEVVIQYLDRLATGYRLSYLGTKFEVSVHTDAQHRLAVHMKEKPKLDLTRVILSPMPGSVVSVAVKEGDVVAEGSELAVVEAMKMQNVIRAPRVGKVKKVMVKAGQSVQGDEVMIELFPEEGAEKKKKA